MFGVASHDTWRDVIDEFPWQEIRLDCAFLKIETIGSYWL